MSSLLADELSATDWAGNVKRFCSSTRHVERIEVAVGRVALWGHELERSYPENKALPFLREARVQAQQGAALVALALYRPSAAASRAVVESALYFSYFRDHPVELATLARSRGVAKDWYIDKRQILDYHREHTLEFEHRQGALDLVAHLERWYRHVSSVVHGQKPGLLLSHVRLSQLRHTDDALDASVSLFEEAAEVLHRLFLVTLAGHIWPDLDPEVRRSLSKGTSKEKLKVLGLT